ncbi:hypothetical protein [Actinokineospora inagensis]|uniref:hypothetical protein n=1 Tax=Actinokineospora inagensis TaxID=103730 RepID=UPI00040D2311|nr:hypothetical protein [Actinokineospora inagensis]
MGFNSSAARLVGSALDGLVLGVFGLAWVITADRALTVAAALLFASMPTAATRTTTHRWLDGVTELTRGRLRAVSAILVLIALAQGMFLVLFIVFVTGPLGEGETEVGLLRGVQAIGGLIAGLTTATLTRRLTPARLLAAGCTALLGLRKFPTQKALVLT